MSEGRYVSEDLCEVVITTYYYSDGMVSYLSIIGILKFNTKLLGLVFVRYDDNITCTKKYCIIIEEY